MWFKWYRRKSRWQDHMWDKYHGFFLGIYLASSCRLTARGRAMVERKIKWVRWIKDGGFKR